MQQFDRTTPAVAQATGFRLSEWTEFVKKHGGPAVQIETNFWILPDGACAKSSIIRSGYFDPPEPPTGFDCLNLRRKYWTELLSRYVHFFKRIKSDAMNANRYTIAWPGEIAGEQPSNLEGCLNRLKVLADRARKMLTDLAKQIADTPEGQREIESEEAAKQRKASLAESRQRATAATQAARDKIMALSID